jgi:hypothetical protein
MFNFKHFSSGFLQTMLNKKASGKFLRVRNRSELGQHFFLDACPKPKRSQVTLLLGCVSQTEAISGEANSGKTSSWMRVANLSDIFPILCLLIVSASDVSDVTAKENLRAEYFILAF